MVQRPIEEWWSDVDPVIQHWFETRWASFKENYQL